MLILAAAFFQCFVCSSTLLISIFWITCSRGTYCTNNLKRYEQRVYERERVKAEKDRLSSHAEKVQMMLLPVSSWRACTKQCCPACRSEIGCMLACTREVHARVHDAVECILDTLEGCCSRPYSWPWPAVAALGRVSWECSISRRT